MSNYVEVGASGLHFLEYLCSFVIRTIIDNDNILWRNRLFQYGSYCTTDAVLRVSTCENYEIITQEDCNLAASD